jgi:hypothetical protein
MLMWHVAELDALHVKRIHLVDCFHIVNVGRRLKRERQVVAIGRINKLQRFFLDVEYLEVEDKIKC